MLRPRRFALMPAVLALLGTLTLSCTAGEDPTAPAPPAAVAEAAPAESRLLRPLLNGLLACYPQPYAAASAVIGPAGGQLRIGRHLLVVPAGALAAPVRISGEAPTGVVSSVRFEPEGLHFQRAVQLTLDYSTCPLGRLQILKRVAYTDDQLNILTYLLSRDDLLRMRVTGDVWHFSRYAVAW
ncbi:MAG: hypothetical protein U0104_01860 [Gemmatimonadales bacterium]